jgi:hypothetical protein
MIMASARKRAERADAAKRAASGNDNRKGDAPATTSTHFARLSGEADRKGSLSVTEMIEIMGASSIPFTILLLTLPTIAPIPGPLGMIFGTCLAIVSVQIMIGARRLHLPGLVGRRRLSSGNLERVLRHTAPMLLRVERRLKAGRWQSLSWSGTQRLMGVPVLLLAVAIALPIPFGNLLPALALIVLALALLQRDGLAMLGGLFLGLLAVLVDIGLVYAFLTATTLALN